MNRCSERERCAAGNRKGAGFTLLELMLAFTLFGVIAGSIGLVTRTFNRAFRAGVAGAALDSNLRRSMDFVCDRLRAVSSSTLIPLTESPFSTTQVDFQRAVGNLGPSVVWGDPERILFEYSPGETDDGVDNDGNGLIDEGRVVWIQNAGTANEARATLCNWVREYFEGEADTGVDDNGNGRIDERGFSIDFEGNRAHVRLSLEQRDSEGLSIVRTLERTVTFRNQGDDIP